MENYTCEYLIVGAGLAGAKAVEGIREFDARRPIMLVGAEAHFPYDRPPLSKKLWLGTKTVESIFLQDQAFYDRNGVTYRSGCRVVRLDAERRTAWDERGASYTYGKLLLATGGTPRRLPIPGGDAEGLCYYRNLDDYQRLRTQVKQGSTAVVVGGGFIGSEMAAALCANGVEVTVVFPSSHLCDRIFPRDLGAALERAFVKRGIRVIKGDKPAMIARRGSRFEVRLEGGETLTADVALVGVGLLPEVSLAEQAGVRADDGVPVNAFLRTARRDIYAAGDNARFPYLGQGSLMRLEHWDNALNQGRWAGRNMAGACVPYTYMPYFFSDLFEFGYEAVGEIDASMQVVADWVQPNERGVLYYVRDRTVRGVLLCNVWDRVPVARDLIREGRTVASLQDVRGAVPL